MLDWMVWTVPVAVFFSAIVLLLMAMTIWELRSPTVQRKGFLPIPTTRGDRLFIGLLTAAWINLVWVGGGERLAALFGSGEEPSVWVSFVASMLVLIGILRRG